MIKERYGYFFKEKVGDVIEYVIYLGENRFWGWIWVIKFVEEKLVALLLVLKFY